MLHTRAFTMTISRLLLGLLAVWLGSVAAQGGKQYKLPDSKDDFRVPVCSSRAYVAIR